MASVDGQSLWSRVIAIARASLSDARELDITAQAASMAYYLLLALVPIAALFGALAAALPDVSVVHSLPESVIPSATVVPDAAQGEMARRFGELLRPFTSAVSVVTLLVGASLVFRQFVRAVALIWGNERTGSRVRSALRPYALGLALLALGAVAALVASALSRVFVATIGAEIVAVAATIGIDLTALMQPESLQLGIDLASSLVLFWTMFTLVPSRSLRMRDTLPGAAVTALAYTLGQTVLGAYLSSSWRFSLGGQIGGTLAFLVWAYYTCLIVLAGAVLSRRIVLSVYSPSGAESPGS